MVFNFFTYLKNLKKSDLLLAFKKKQQCEFKSLHLTKPEILKQIALWSLGTLKQHLKHRIVKLELATNKKKSLKTYLKQSLKKSTSTKVTSTTKLKTKSTLKANTKKSNKSKLSVFNLEKKNDKKQ